MDATAQHIIIRRVVARRVTMSLNHLADAPKAIIARKEQNMEKDAIEALEQTIRLWEWLAATGDGNKIAWPGWAEKRGPTLNYCFLCNYVGLANRLSPNCPACPLYGKWGAEHCYDPFTPFDLWRQAGIKGRKKCAQDIVDLCIAELARRRAKPCTAANS